MPKKKLLSSWQTTCSFPAYATKYDLTSLWWIADSSYAWEGLSCDEMCWALGQEDVSGKTYICDQDYLNPRQVSSAGSAGQGLSNENGCIEKILSAARNVLTTCDVTNAHTSSSGTVPFVSSKPCANGGASCFTCGWDTSGRGAACDARVKSSFRWVKNTTTGGETYEDTDFTYRRICPCRGITSARKQGKKLAQERKNARNRIMQSKKRVLASPFAPGGALYNPNNALHVNAVEACKQMSGSDKLFWVLATGKHVVGQTEWYTQTCTWTCARYGGSCNEGELRKEFNHDSGDTYKNLKRIVFLKDLPETGQESLTTWCTDVERRYFDAAMSTQSFPVPAVTAANVQKCWTYGGNTVGGVKTNPSSGGGNGCGKHWPAVPADVIDEGALGNKYQRLCPCSAQCDANFGQVGCRDGKQQWIWYHDACWKTGKCDKDTFAKGRPSAESCANWKRPEWGQTSASAGDFFSRPWGKY